MDKAGDERGTRGDKRDLCQDCLRLFHTAGIMKGRNRWGALLGMLVSDGAGDGVREGSHPLALSRGCSGGDLGFRYTPSGDGEREGCDPLALSRGAVLVRISVSDGAGAGVLVKDLASDEAGVGRSAPLHPLGGRGARGLRPSRALTGLCWRGFGFSTELVRAFW